MADMDAPSRRMVSLEGHLTRREALGNIEDGTRAINTTVNAVVIEPTPSDGYLSPDVRPQLGNDVGAAGTLQ